MENVLIYFPGKKPSKNMVTPEEHIFQPPIRDEVRKSYLDYKDERDCVASASLMAWTV